MTSIEDIILGNDQRGVSGLRRHLPPNFCDDAARFALANPGTAFIVTGFYISMAGAPETDGPPGALAIGRALASLGWRVVHVADRHTMPVLRPFVNSDTEVIDFPIAGDGVSSRFATGLLTTYDPSLLISIERCGLTRDGRYLNMRGVDISPNTARGEQLFLQHSRTIGIGDGGNEIGMGNLAHFIPEVPSLPDNPAVTRTTHLIISSTSNWGGYGLVAALSRQVQRDLLPVPEEETALISRIVDLGAVDGVTGQSQYTVDAMSMEAHGQALVRLHQLLEREAIVR
jgi:hypothetical protein